MIRDVNLIKHLPPFVQDYREIQGIMNAENPEFQSIESSFENTLDNTFILYADDVAIERYEKMFGLNPSNSDDLESRRMVVLSKYTNNDVLTLRTLVERLKIMFGIGFVLMMSPYNYYIEVTLHVRFKSLVGAVASMLREIIPANMVVTCVVEYNKHEVLAKYPTYLLMQFNHQELFNESIEDKISASCDNFTNYTMESLKRISCEHISKYGMRKGWSK